MYPAQFSENTQSSDHDSATMEKLSASIHVYFKLVRCQAQKRPVLVMKPGVAPIWAEFVING